MCWMWSESPRLGPASRRSPNFDRTPVPTRPDPTLQNRAVIAAWVQRRLVQRIKIYRHTFLHATATVDARMRLEVGTHVLAKLRGQPIRSAIVVRLNMAGFDPTQPTNGGYPPGHPVNGSPTIDGAHGAGHSTGPFGIHGGRSLGGSSPGGHSQSSPNGSVVSKKQAKSDHSWRAARGSDSDTGLSAGPGTASPWDHDHGGGGVGFGGAATYALSFFDGSQDHDVAAADIIRPRDRQGGDQVRC